MRKDKFQIGDICVPHFRRHKEDYLLKILDVHPKVKYEVSFCVLVECVKNKTQYCVGYNQLSSKKSATGVLAVSLNNSPRAIYKLNKVWYKENTNNIYTLVYPGFKYYTHYGELMLTHRDIYSVLKQALEE